MDLNIKVEETESTKGDEQKRNSNCVTKKCEELKLEYDALYRKYIDFENEQRMSGSGTRTSFTAKVDCELQSVKCEKNKLIISSKQMDELQQNYAWIKRQRDEAIRQSLEAKHYLIKVQQQRDDALNKVNEAVSMRIKATRDLARLTKERNDAVKEYNLIMSERDSVHEDIKNMQLESSEIKKKLKNFEKENSELFTENQSLKKQIISLLLKNERLVKDCNYLRIKVNVLKRNEQFSRTSTSSSASLSQTSTSSDFESSSQNSKRNDLNRENTKTIIENLRTEIDYLSNSVRKSEEEVIAWKSKHEKCANEKLKVILEKTSVEALSNQYRKERETALFRLTETLNDLNDSKIETEDLRKQVTLWKEKYDSLNSELEVRMQRDKSNNSQMKQIKNGVLLEDLHHSSSVNALNEKRLIEENALRLHELTAHSTKIQNVDDNESHEFSENGEMGKLFEPRTVSIRKSKQPLGMKLVSSKSGAVFVAEVMKNSLAEKAGVQANDQLLEVCGINLRNSRATLAMRILDHCVEDIQMLLQFSPQSFLQKANHKATLV
ncbi:Disks large-like protein [Leptotrombidium deliense]|uniref:Disks large-like protein n=1 Tax=Leptotrombidium deliense TaxID=299467 RepID=A0A443SC23_9ACAR|nr:Disks large-like protein [Leptotrombidium deliense]